jgi:type II secretory pathway pseudopilin PulG
MNHATNRRGFTLVEAMLAAVILSMTVCCVLAPFVAGAQNDQDNAKAVLASALAQELMEDILTMPFADPQTPDALTPGPDAGETADPRTFDNVDDYDGLYEPPGSFADRPVSGPVARDLWRRAAVGYVYVPGQDAGQPPSFCRVTVTVGGGPAELVRLTRLVYANPRE